MPGSKLLSHLRNILLSTDDACSFETRKANDPGQMDWHLVSKLFGVKFYWEFGFKLVNWMSLKDQFVIPLLFSVREYQQRETELIKIIQSKDKEIDDYKSQGFKLVRSGFN